MKTISFLKSLSWLVVLNMLVKPVWIFGIDRQLQNLTGPVAYGQYFALFNLSLVFSFITDAGLTSMTNQQLASGQPLPLKALLRLKGSLSLLYIIVVLLIAYITGVSNKTVLILVLLIQVATSFFVFLRSLITAHQLFGIDAWLSVFDKALLIIIGGSFLYFPLLQNGISISFFLVLQLGSLLLALLLTTYILFRKKLFATTAVNGPKIYSLLKAATPYATIILLMSAHNRLDAFLLERLRPDGAYQAGVYASAYRLLDAGNVVGYLFASFLMPFMARHQQHTKLLEGATTMARHILMLIGGAAVVFTFFYAPAIHQLLYHHTSNLSIVVLQQCMAVLPAYLLLHIYGSALTATASFRSFILLLSFSVVINVVLNVLLIPGYGAEGCTIAALVSQYSCAIAAMIVATKKLGMHFRWRSIAGYILFLLLLSLLGYRAQAATVSLLTVLLFTALIICLMLFMYIPYVKKYFLSIS